MDGLNLKAKHWAIVAACAILSCGASAAEILRYEFTGTVTSSTYVAQPGEEVTGTFSYDTGSPPVSTCFNNSCTYYDPNGSMTMKIGGHQMSASATHVEVLNDQGITGYEDVVRVTGSPAVIDGTSYPTGFMMLWMVASKPQVLADTSMPRDYQVHRFDIVREGGFTTGSDTLGGTLLYFKIDSIKVLQPSQQ